MGIRILSPGFHTTVQDLGRTGFQQYGVPVAGAVDPRSLRLANLLAGNEESAAALEATLLPPEIEFTGEGVFAVTGGDFSPTLNGIPLPAYRAVRARTGDVLRMEAARSGCRCYIAFSGGLDVPVAMGSRSTYEKAHLGGLEGRPLRAGDEIGILPAALPDNLPARFMPPDDFSAPVKVLRVVLGPQRDRFTEEGVAAFLRSEYAISSQFDRMGCRLEGAGIAHRQDANIISDGIAFGAVQVPGSGQPIVMLADRQTTGGYAKIANVISRDLPLIAQCRAGDRVRFEAISVEEAQAVYLAERAEIAALAQRWQRPTGPERRFRISVGGRSYAVDIAELS
ncbi:MAG: biotin-dependent carboxyltransferase family protein [Clostridia bacterium]|nr:biotin-dependent carboxyltransferase family protein [Clostridia bacterium]